MPVNLSPSSISLYMPHHAEYCHLLPSKEGLRIKDNYRNLLSAIMRHLYPRSGQSFSWLRPTEKAHVYLGPLYGPEAAAAVLESIERCVSEIFSTHGSKILRSKRFNPHKYVR